MVGCPKMLIYPRRNRAILLSGTMPLNKRCYNLSNFPIRKQAEKERQLV